MGSGISDIIGSIGSVKNAAEGNWPGDDTQPTDINPAPTGTPGVAGVVPTGTDSGTDSRAKKKTPSPLMQGVGTGIANGLSSWDTAKARIAAGGRGAAPITAPQPVGQVVQPNLDYLNAARARYSVPSAFYGG